MIFLPGVVVAALDPTLVVKDKLADVHTDSLHGVVEFDQHNIHQEMNAPTLDTAPLLPEELGIP